MAKSLIVNSIWVYSQKFSTAAITLVSTPIILNNLGVEDYGIYSLTIGLVAVFNVLNWSLTAATQRFIAVSIGKGDDEELKSIFNNSFFIHLGYGTLLLLVIGSIGLFFIDAFLEIPSDRIKASKIIIIFAAMITFFQMLAMPYKGLLKAYEEFNVVSLIGILDSFLKLLAALLLFISPVDKLVFFAILMAISSAIIYCALVLFVSKKYTFLKLSIQQIQRSKLRELFSFTSWNIIGAVALIGRNQGIGVVLNLFFGVVANAAYGIAMQVQSAIAIFSQGIITTMSPRIMKSAGNRDDSTALYYASAASKFGLLAVAFIAIPLLVNMETVLNLWLGILPEYAVVYAQLIIGFVFATGLSIGLQTVFQGINKVKAYNIIVSVIILFNIPIAILFFYFNYPSFYIFIISISLELACFIVRLYLLSNYMKFSIPTYIYSVIIQTLLPITVSTLACVLVSNITVGLFVQLSLSTLVSSVVLAVLIYIFSLNQEEKNVLSNKLTFLNKKQA